MMFQMFQLLLLSGKALAFIAMTLAARGRPPQLGSPNNQHDVANTTRIHR
jgi:hypothetical protein